MSKRKGNDFGRITRRSDSKQPSTHARKTASVSEDKPDKKKLTLYLDPEILKRVRRMEFDLREHFDDLSHKYSRTAIIDAALEIALDGFDSEAFDSLIVDKLHDRAGRS